MKKQNKYDFIFYMLKNQLIQTISFNIHENNNSIIKQLCNYSDQSHKRFSFKMAFCLLNVLYFYHAFHNAFKNQFLFGNYS